MRYAGLVLLVGLPRVSPTVGAETRGVASLPLMAWEGRTMGTFYTVKIAGVAPDEKLLADLRAAVDRRLDEINGHMSHYQPDSELSRFNASTSLAPVKVSAELARVTRKALELNRQSEGAFDPTLGWLIDLWGFGPSGQKGLVPTDEQVAVCRGKCGAGHLKVTADGDLQKDIPDLRLNLGGIAKGYGADEVALLLRARGYTNIIVSICGEIVAFGVNAEGQPWQVGVEKPAHNASRGAELVAVAPISGRAFSTSGDAHNYFTDTNGVVYAHILDPSTGRPVHHNLASVTVIGPDGTTADGTATALFVMGAERGLRWVEERPDIAALFVVRDGETGFRLIPSKRFPPIRRPE